MESNSDMDDLDITKIISQDDGPKHPNTRCCPSGRFSKYRCPMLEDSGQCRKYGSHYTKISFSVCKEQSDEDPAYYNFREIETVSIADRLKSVFTVEDPECPGNRKISSSLLALLIVNAIFLFIYSLFQGIGNLHWFSILLLVVFDILFSLIMRTVYLIYSSVNALLRFVLILAGGLILFFLTRFVLAVIFGLSSMAEQFMITLFSLVILGADFAACLAVSRFEDKTR